MSRESATEIISITERKPTNVFIRMISRYGYLGRWTVENSIRRIHFKKQQSYVEVK